MSIYIKNFSIEHYKGINGLELDELNEINILTGDNNSGKTSVLELMTCVDNPQQKVKWIKISRRNKNRNFYEGIYDLFPTEEEELKVSFLYQKANIEETKKIELMGMVEETQISEKEKYQVNGYVQTGEPNNADEEMLDTKCMKLSIRIDEIEVEKFELYDFQTRVSVPIKRRQELSFVRAVYVSPSEHVSGNFSLEHVLNDSEMYSEMLDVLRDFDDGITNIIAARKENVQTVEYMIVSKNHKRALPLSSYGDGMKKTIMLLAAVVEAKNGILLLDEFETAIHTSAMDKVFSWILKSAMKLNVQIFLSSHSKEAIEKVLKCDENLQPKINVYTLYNRGGKNFVRKMKCLEAIKAQDNWGVELR